MSENIDLDSNNLCIPEDAFEQFQAVSMYQEEEYIAITEIGSATRKDSDPGELNQLTYDNEVVVTTENEVNSTVNDCTEEAETSEQHNFDSTHVSTCSDVVEEQNVMDQENKPVVNRRRGRKKKQLHNDKSGVQNNLEAVSLNQNSDNIRETEKECPEISSTVVFRKRGRKPKPKLTNTAEIEIEVPQSDQDHTVTDISFTSFSSDPENSDNVTAGNKKKRGRPRKIKDTEQSSELSGSDNPNNLKVPRRRGRPKKQSLNSCPGTDEIQSGIENPSCNIIENTESTNLQSPKTSDSIDKIERDSMQIDATGLESIESNNRKMSSDNCRADNSDMMSDDNDLDDISLSKLKQLPDICKTSNNIDSCENNEAVDSTNIISEEHKHSPTSSPPQSLSAKKSDKVIKKRLSKPDVSVESSVKEEPITEETLSVDVTTVVMSPFDDNDETDNLSLSELRHKTSEALKTENSTVTEVSSTDVPIVEDENKSREVNGTSSKRNTKMPMNSDFEYNIDSVLGESNANQQDADNSLLVEDTSKRPTRRKIKKLHYEEESDEDPFANIELSDDDMPRKRKGNRYYSDDEYVPGRKGNKDIDSTDSEANELLKGELKKQKKKTLRKKSDNQSSRKKVKKDDTCLNLDSDGIEICVENSEVKASDDSQQSQSSKLWGSSNEFENFLAKRIQGTNLKIKKVSSSEPIENKQLEIPTIDPGAKRMIEMCSQTDIVNTVSTGVQTTSPYDIPIKENISLTPEQSEKACFFLNSIVKTTSELGTLMTQKSEDFIKKKINTTHVTDTMKMDYCVKKSFLLFKLAKHNLMQMEEDLAKQYEKFLETNNLSRCRELPKKVEPSPKAASSDSDCEIVEETIAAPKKPTEKPKFNPKTVFLNKELSIKIAKKPTENKKLDIKGRHTVWINDTVVVKKVKPTQSFLAQDSRNKKPPDSKITIEMVSNFFKNYYRQKALSVCAPFITTDWLHVSNECVCNYFVATTVELKADCNYSQNSGITMNHTGINSNASETSHDLNAVTSKAITPTVTCPEPLFKQCFRILKNQMQHINHVKEDCHIRNELTDGKEEPVTLFRLCLRALTSADTIMERSPTPLSRLLPLRSPTPSSSLITSRSPTPLSCILPLGSPSSVTSPLPLRSPIPKESIPSNKASQKTVLPLKNLCYKRIVKLLSYSTQQQTDNLSINEHQESLGGISCSTDSHVDFPICKSPYISPTIRIKNGIKPLLSLCIEFIQSKQIDYIEKIDISRVMPKLLKSLAFEQVKLLLYGDWDDYLSQTDALTLDHECDAGMVEGLTINSINTLSEEAFLNLEQSHNDDNPHSPQEYFDDFNNEDDFHDNFVEAEEENQTDTSWVTQLQITATGADGTPAETIPIIAQIKLEPLEDTTENVVSPPLVKTEPGPGPDEMLLIPDLKAESIANTDIDPIQDEGAYNVDAFEQFVTSNKLMRSIHDDVFSQSALRVRRQHEPDYEEDPDMSMSLLVPQTYEPLSIETAKGSLMQSSSDEENSKQKKGTAKKKPEKRKTKQKKTDLKTNNKDVPTASTSTKDTTTKEKVTNNEVANLTRRLRDKIRQEEQRDDSTDSENENLTLNLRNRKEKDRSKQNQNQQTQKSKSSEIQCSNVDSTDQLDDDTSIFTGFSAIDQNEISTYQKYMKYVYDKIIPSNEEEINKSQNSAPKPEGKETENIAEKPLISNDEPVEMLECEPTMPFFDDLVSEKKTTRRSKGKVEKKVVTKEEIPKKKEVVNKRPVEQPVKENEIVSKETAEKEEISKVSQEEATFIERHGWHCHPIKFDDSKLYQSACVFLEKLPESFVQTYFEYQGITRKDKTDQEIDRLTNLNSLNRTVSQLKDLKQKTKSKRDTKSESFPPSNKTSEAGSRGGSPTFSNCGDELEPSDDEGTRMEDETAPSVVEKHAENTLAKNFLMHDNDSDLDEPIAKIKQEPSDETNDSKKVKPGSKSKKKEEVVENSGDLMLTADKMMNKELSLLHAPIVLKHEDVKPTTSTGPVTRNKHKSGMKQPPSGQKIKNEEDSSSEEEKQWVTTKEKLLKRLGKKEDSVDDAKRAKLVSEFIEKRGGLSESHLRPRNTNRSRRSSKKFLERQKQLRVLSRELFGESSDGTTLRRTTASQFLYKGRRNIRKVIDKKSLARSTVVANMEEFERKKRLNARQTRLRELLGCEEGVNVLVINDEVCLEYDFDENRPVVTIHPFFTKVMKAHQYEGVKFMWDACFESLAHIESGHPGGGCILAHCMGLGKTLQVLALLHTVLTHPRVGMQRVLVCCPLSTVLNWVDEIHKWIGPVTNKIKVFELSKLKKTYERAYQLEDWYNGGGIFIIGYELFRSLSTLDPFLDDVRPTIINKIRTALLDPGPDIIVCDEGHLLKNDCSVLAVAMSRVVTKRRIILTGTPMQNNLREYYCMVNFVKPNLLGTYSEYSNRFENPIMNGQHRDSREEDIKLMKARTHILHKVLEGCLQRQEASVLYPYLPKKHEYTVFITLTQCQWDLYKHYLHHYAKQSKQSILKDFHTLQKIWSHPQVLHNFQTKARDRDEKNKVKLEKIEDDLATEDQEEIKPNDTEVWWLQYLDDGKMLETLDSSNKFVVVFRILDECIALGDKVLIFSTSLFCLDALEYFLKKINNWSLGQEYYRLDGSVPAEVRQKWCREFNADNNYKTKLFLVSTRAGCLGLNMTAANRVIIMDTSWNPAHDIQSIFRVYRFGQKKDCFIYRLVAMGTMEQKIYERAVTKQAVACRVVDEQQIDRHYNMAELTELYKYDEVGSGVAGGVAVGVCDVALLRVARHAALHAVHEHDSLLRGSSEQGLPEHERNAAWMQFQQEHAHKQIENKLVVNIPKVPNISLKRVHGQDYALKSQTEVDVKTEDNSDDFVPNEPKTKKGKKSNVIKCNIPVQDDSKPAEISTVKTAVPTPRGRPRKDAPKPGTSKEPVETTVDGSEGNPISEEVMVEKITDILLQHNFQNRKSGTEISNLVMKVRQMVKRGYVTSEDMSDNLSASIAKILLPKQMPLPKVTDIMCESLNKSAEPTSIPDEPEMITSDPTPKFNNTDQSKESKTRTRRKAAIAAAKTMDYLTQDVVIHLDDDDNSNDTDFLPDAEERVEKQYVNNNKGKKNLKAKNLSPPRVVDDDESTLSAPSAPNSDWDGIPSDQDLLVEKPQKKEVAIENATKPKSMPKSKKSSKNNIAENKAIPNKETPKNNFAVIDSSILLSDDDEPMSRKVPRKRVTVQELQKIVEAEKDAAKAAAQKPVAKVSQNPVEEKKPSENAVEKPAEPDNDDIVPLPLSLLKNQNFINIVAHTYLRGNPMLDEDAATLAAQYSTLKALKEAEQTGKNLCSGPIYDIAIKVIGKEILKKMHSVNPTAAQTSAIDAVASIQRNEELIAAEKNKHTLTATRSLRDSIINEKLGLQSSTEVNAIASKPTPSTSNAILKTSKVVPVGLIKTAAGVAANETIGPQNVECILPDDDDIIINQLNSPVHKPAPPEPPVNKKRTIVYKKRLSIDNNMPIKVTAGNKSTETSSTVLLQASYPARPGNPKLTLTPTTSASSPTICQVVTTPTYHSIAPKPMDNDYTICLDSDEEEPTRVVLQPPVQTQPVPVSLTMANAPGIKLPLPNMHHITPITSVQQQLPPMPNLISAATGQPHPTLVLRQVTGEDAQTKLVLISSDQLPKPTAPAIPEQPVISNTQPKLSCHNHNLLGMPGDSLLTPKVDNNSAPNTTRCKPGDILRISKTGKIEVIPREEFTSKSQLQAQTVHIQQPQTSQLLYDTLTTESKTPSHLVAADKLKAPSFRKIEPKPSKPESVKLLNTSTEKVSQKAPLLSSANKNQNSGGKKYTILTEKSRVISSSSSSGSSRGSTPERSPLSILKDVVHIQAEDYVTTLGESTHTTKSGKQSIVVRTEKYRNCNIGMQHVISSEDEPSPAVTKPSPAMSKPSPAVTKPSPAITKPSPSALKNAIKLTKVPKNQLPAHVDKVVQQLKKDPLVKKIPQPQCNNQNLSVVKTPDKKTPPVSTSNEKKSVSSSKSKVNVGGTSSKVTATVDLTNIGLPSTSALKTKIEPKKRPSTVGDTVTTVKKKKTEPMTLKDFNLDDFDDIIELE